MHEAAEQAKNNFLQAKQRLIRALETTPDDRINWSPAPTARTPVQLVAHTAWAVKSILTQLQGTPFPIPSTAEADESFREWEKEFTTREQALDLLEKNSAEFLAWLDTVTPEQLDATVQLPFGLGFAPARMMLDAPHAHTNYHVAQMDYLQTTYGDQDWHL